MVLFLRNWIRSGVNKISDLHFVVGKLDLIRMYDIIVFKSNILTELLTMREALLPYQECLRNIDRVRNVQEPQQFKPKKSRDFYLLFRQMLTKDSPIVTNYLKGYCNKDDCTFVFIKKIVQEKEIKLKEFYYKLLYGILPCNKNLRKLKVKLNDECDVCQQQQSIKHLLWECVDNTPKIKWPLGRVIELHPGRDELVRSVTLKTAKGIVKRSIQCLRDLELV